MEENTTALNAQQETEAGQELVQNELSDTSQQTEVQVENQVAEDELVVIELDNGHLYVYNKNLAVRKANVAEVNVEI